MKVSIDWLNDYLPVKWAPAELAERLTMAGLEVKGIDSIQGDRVMEIEITSNRPDWLSHVGVAREVGALSGRSIKQPASGNDFARQADVTIPIRIKDLSLCPYYTGCLLEGVEFGESPDYIKRRLEAIGMRPINLVVDVTNYVLMEIGQPLHAFDWTRLRGGEIVVRRANNGEKIVAIDGAQYELDNRDLVIADSDHPIAIAGVMGGKESEVSPKTHTILLESAYFLPSSVRRTSKKLSLTSESSYRFERGVDPRGVDLGRERAIHLIKKHAKRVGKVSPVFKGGRPPVKEPVILFPLNEIKRILGVDIPAGITAGYLKNLGLKVGGRSKTFFSVKVPSFRPDLTRPVDLVEEVARIHGFDRIPETLPETTPVYIPARPAAKVEKSIREICLSAGFSEAVTFSLTNEKIYEKLGLSMSAYTSIVNPQNKELTLMRPALIPSLLEAVKTNVYHATGSDIRLFEVANVYGSEQLKRLPPEEMTVGIIMTGAEPQHWLSKPRKHSVYEVKGVIEQILIENGIAEYEFSETQNPFFAECFTVVAQGERIGMVGRVADKVREFYDVPSEVFAAELSVEKTALIASFERKFKVLPKFPASRRDIALVLDEQVKAKEVVETAAHVDRKFIRGVDVIDLYRGGQVPAGKKSLAISVEYRSDERTLTNEEIHSLHQRVIDALISRFKASLRS